MKQVFLLVAVVALAGTAWFNHDTSTAGTVSADVYSRFFLDAKVGQHVAAQFYNSAETLQELACEATEEPGFISCQFPEEFAGKEVAVELTKNNVMYVSVVNVPAE
jgi:hypothetical protein